MVSIVFGLQSVNFLTFYIGVSYSFGRTVNWGWETRPRQGFDAREAPGILCSGDDADPDAGFEKRIGI